MKKLFAGPFVGEFGHELFCWQGKIRYIAGNYDHVTVSCMPGHQCLYEDFADEIIEYQPETYIPDCSWNRGKTENYPKPDYDCDYIPPNHQIIQIYDPEQNFIPIGNGKNTTYDFVFAARSTNKNGSGYRDWPKEKWDKLAERLIAKGYKICSIGKSGFSYHVPGTENLMDISLSDLADTLSTSSYIVGGSSGPIHFATLCKTKQIVWSGDRMDMNRKRYEDTWNPFDIEVTFIEAQDWNPNLDLIYNICIEKIQNK